VNKLLG